MVLIGTTGVGKTTTLAKGATRFAYMLDKDYKVAIFKIWTHIKRGGFMEASLKKAMRKQLPYLASEFT